MEELKFKASLVYWKFYETNLIYTNKEITDILAGSGAGYQPLERFCFENNSHEKVALTALSTTANLFLPACFTFHTDSFHSANDNSVKGEIRINAHLYPEGVLVFHTRLDFENIHSIDTLIRTSKLKDIILSDGTDADNKIELKQKEIISLLKEEIKHEKKLSGHKPSTWHHTWIWWKTDPEISVTEFDKNGRFYRMSIGMCSRKHNWRSLDEKNYSTAIEDISNSSPYRDNCIFIAYSGNFIIPGQELCDSGSRSNTLTDVLFAAEIGYVQRYLILNYLQNFNFESLEIQRNIQKFKDKKMALKETMTALEEIEGKVNDLVLEVNKDLQIFRTPRLIFSDIFKITVFKKMVSVLSGFEYYDNLTALIDDIRSSIKRQRDEINMKVMDRENFFLKNIQTVFIIGLIAQLITLYYGVEKYHILVGTLFVLLSVVLSVIIVLLINRLSKK